MNYRNAINVNPESPDKAMILSLRCSMRQLYAVDTDSMNLARTFKHLGRTERRIQMTMIKMTMGRNDSINRPVIWFKAYPSFEGAGLERINYQPGSISG